MNHLELKSAADIFHKNLEGNEDLLPYFFRISEEIINAQAAYEGLEISEKKIWLEIDKLKNSVIEERETFQIQDRLKNANKNIFSFGHYFVLHAQNIYKIFKPNLKSFKGDQIQPKVKKLRKQRLSEFFADKTLNLEILNSTLRNHLEHFDERLDLGFASKNLYKLGFNQLEVSNSYESKISSGDLYNFMNGKFTFDNDIYDLKPINLELQKIKGCLKEKLPLMFEIYEGFNF